jgi:hypothetical protein
MRLASTLGWNTFPVPTLTEQNKVELTRCAEDILVARRKNPRVFAFGRNLPGQSSNGRLAACLELPLHLPMDAEALVVRQHQVIGRAIG